MNCFAESLLLIFSAKVWTNLNSDFPVRLTYKLSQIVNQDENRHKLMEDRQALENRQRPYYDDERQRPLDSRRPFDEYRPSNHDEIKERARPTDVVGFSAVRARKESRRSGANVIKFKNTLVDSNYGWNSEDSVFKAHFPGLYFFTFSLKAETEYDNTYKVSLLKNGKEMVSVGGSVDQYNRGGTSASSSIILDLLQDDKVSLQLVRGRLLETTNSNTGYTSFAGYRLGCDMLDENDITNNILANIQSVHNKPDELDNQDQNQLDYDQNQQVGYYDDQQGQDEILDVGKNRYTSLHYERYGDLVKDEPRDKFQNNNRFWSRNRYNTESDRLKDITFLSVDRDSNRDRYFLDNNRNSDRDRHFLGNLKDKNRNSDSTDRDRDIHYLGINRLGETNKDRNSFGMDRDRDYFIRDRNSLDRDRLERLPMFDRNSYDDKQSYSNLHFNTRKKYSSKNMEIPVHYRGRDRGDAQDSYLRKSSSLRPSIIPNVNTKRLNLGTRRDYSNFFNGRELPAAELNSAPIRSSTVTFPIRSPIKIIDVSPVQGDVKDTLDKSTNQYLSYGKK